MAAANAGVPTKRLSEMYVTIGDLGDVAAKCKGKQPMLAPLPRLKARDVFEKLHKIAEAKGAGSAGHKQQIMTRMLRAGQCAPGCILSVMCIAITYTTIDSWQAITHIISSESLHN